MEAARDACGVGGEVHQGSLAQDVRIGQPLTVIATQKRDEGVRRALYGVRRRSRAAVED